MRLKFTDLVDFIMGIFRYKFYHCDIPRNFENYPIEKHNIHGYTNKLTDYIHIAYADTKDAT